MEYSKYAIKPGAVIQRQQVQNGWISQETYWQSPASSLTKDRANRSQAAFSVTEGYNSLSRGWLHGDGYHHFFKIANFIFLTKLW